jgi:hypothetical protein
LSFGIQQHGGHSQGHSGGGAVQRAVQNYNNNDVKKTVTAEFQMSGSAKPATGQIIGPNSGN